MLRRGLPGWAGQSLKQGGRVVGHHTEAFVGIDASKLRNAVAIADSSRGGEVRYLGEFPATEAAIQKARGKACSEIPRQEGSELAGDRRCRNRGLLAPCNEPTVSGRTAAAAPSRHWRGRSRADPSAVSARSRRSVPKIGRSTLPRSAHVVHDGCRSW